MALITNQGKNLLLNRALQATPTQNAVIDFKVGTGTTAAAITDTDLETPVSIDGDNFKNFESGSPSFTESSQNSQITCRLLRTEANSNSLTEFGIVNDDGTKKLFMRSVHTAIAKTSSKEVRYVVTITQA